MKKNFREFELKDIFETSPFLGGLQVPTGALIPVGKLEPGDIPRISVTSMNNGIIGYYKDVESKNYRTYENCISVSFLGTVFYHPYKASFDMKVHCLKPTNHELRKGEALYLISCIQKLVQNNTYGNQTSSTDLPYMKVYLPVKDNREIDWNYMQEYITELEQKYITELEQYLVATGLNNYKLTEEDTEILYLPVFKNYKDFKVSNLFSLQNVSNKLTKECLSDDYKYPAYSSDTNSNGIVGYTDNPEFICNNETPVYITFGDHTRTLNIARESFAVLDNVKVLIPCINTDEALLFMITQWQKQIPNLGYSRHWKVAKDCIISLPIQLNNDNKPILDKECKYHKDGYIPNWDFMEKYIKVIEKLVITEVVKYKDTFIEQTKMVLNI